MPNERPMPLTGEDRIPPHPTLGDPLDNFPSRRLVILVSAWSLLIGLSLLINLSLWNVDQQSGWIGPFIAGSMGLLAWAIGWRVLHYWNWEVILYERGFTVREGSVNVPFQYAEVKRIRLRAERISIFGGLIRYPRYHMSIHTFPGDMIRITTIYRRTQHLTDKLTQAVNDTLRPTIRQYIADGGEVAFGDDLYASRDGLRVAADALVNTTTDAILPWEAFGGYEVKNRQLFLLNESGERWYGIPLVEVDNLFLFLELLRTHQPKRMEAH